MVHAQSDMREVLWLTCREKTCCHTRLVHITGRDVYRICTTLQIAPTSFLIYGEVAPDEPDGFALDKSERRYRLALSKQAAQSSAAPPCVFLVKSNAGHALCGLGDFRPLTCKTYPFHYARGMLQTVSGCVCTCRTWSTAGLDRHAERAVHARKEAENTEYACVVAEWNRRIVASPLNGRFIVDEYLDYLLATYACMPEEPRA